MVDGNGWTKYEREVMSKLDYLRSDMQSVVKTVAEHAKHCETKFSEHATEIEKSKRYGVFSGAGIVLVFILTLLVMKALQ